MYKHENGVTVYETLEELLNADIDFITECDDSYYIRLKPESYYDNSVWVVNKHTLKVSFMLFTQYFDIMDKATPVNPATLKRVS